MTKIDKAVSWAIDIANDPARGYDQIDRWSPDYDCSSFLISAYEQAGVPVKTNGATYTGNMVKVFLATGFADVTSSVTLSTGAGLQTGDILWVKGHTEMYVGNGQLVGAHIAENGTIYAGQKGDQTGEEINVSSYYNYPWTTVLRYPGGSSDSSIDIDKSDVVALNDYLSLGDMKTNAKYIAKYLLAEGWTLGAISAMLGNMQTESTINPAIWQNLNEGNTAGGLGLVQWTPATNLIDWASGQGLDYLDIDTQLKRIVYEFETGIQYYATEDYPLSPSEFIHSEATPEYLAMVFLNNYERPSDRNQPNRATQARYWYTYLSDIDPDTTPEYVPEENTKKRRGMSLLMMYLATRRK